MKKYTQNIGVYLIIIGTFTLLLTRISTFSVHNWMLLAGLLFIILGIVLHIRSIKKESRY